MTFRLLKSLNTQNATESGNKNLFCGCVSITNIVSSLYLIRKNLTPPDFKYYRYLSAKNRSYKINVHEITWN